LATDEQRDDDGNGLVERADRVKIHVLPNLFTAGNLCFGFLAVVKIIQATRPEELEPKNLNWALVFILAALLCDLLDGRLARYGGYESPFGREFDSLADIVSFGVAPALLVHRIVLVEFPTASWAFAFIYLVCGGLRLARFNVIHSQAQRSTHKHGPIKHFVGFPIPAAAGLIASLVLFIGVYKDYIWGQTARFVLPLILLVLSAAMVSTVPYPSFKTLDWRMQKPFLVFVGLIVLGSLAAALALHEKALAIMLPAIFLTYLFWGLWRWSRSRRQTVEKHAAQHAPP
jgi:CDP-diacylglycerol--serine O-phosphatidyltransferase